MHEKKVTYTTINEYIALYPKEVQVKLKTIRKAIQETAPKATEKISYGIPTFYLNGNLVHFAAYEKHIGLYPGPKAIQEFKKDLEKYTTSKGTVQFPIDSAVPIGLIKKIVRFGMKEMTKNS